MGRLLTKYNCMRVKALKISNSGWAYLASKYIMCTNGSIKMTRILLYLLVLFICKQSLFIVRIVYINARMRLDSGDSLRIILSKLRI